MRSARRDGFTLIELLIVVVVIGILASIAILGYSGVRKRSFVAATEADLRNLVVKQEMHQTRNYTYTTDLSALEHTSSPGVNVSINEATNTGWAATATHDSYADIQCGVYVGTGDPSQATPASGPERVECTD